MDARRAELPLDALRTRQSMLRAMRSFFEARDYLEVDTPVRIPTPALEEHIDAEPAGDCFLRTSPEFHMKRLLVGGSGPLYQIGPCFRRGERGRLHHPEYTMLEWYRPGTDYRGLLDETRDLVLHIADNLLGCTVLRYRGADIDLEASWSVHTVAEAFRRHAAWDPVEQFDADRFDGDLVERIEPKLASDRPSVLMDFPAARAALACLSPSDPRVAERWELYIGGLELANAYSELTDAEEQRYRFEQWSRSRRNAGRAIYPPDEEFLAALDTGLPPCAGCALGVDRLVMLFCDAASLAEILPFRDG
jgi:lysyl-tRNA synthetase class 2